GWTLRIRVGWTSPLSRSPPSVSSCAQGAPQMSSSSENTATILVVEDDADNRENLREILELDGYKVVTASTVAELLCLVPDLKPDLVLADRKLPDGTAEQFIPHLLRLWPSPPPIIVYTGYSDFEGAIAALRMGVRDYILKPGGVDQLRAAVARALSRKLEQP